MDIRKVTLDDAAGFHALFSEVNAEGLFSARTTAPPLSAIARALQTAVEKDWPVCVLEHAGVIVGSAEAYPESFCQAGGQASVGILGMQIRKPYRRQGYGQRLLATVIDHCRQQGFSAIELAVLKSNAAALRLYERYGFVWVEDLPPCTLASGLADQPQKMRLILAPAR